MILLFVDLDFLSCGPCSDWLDALSRALPASLQEASLRAVVTYRDPSAGGAEGRRGRIARLQWRGFAQGRRLGFPVVFDDGQAFREAAAGGAAAILFDFDAGTMKRFAAPLRAGDLDEIAAFLFR